MGLMYNLGHQMAHPRGSGGVLVYPLTYSIISMFHTTVVYLGVLSGSYNILP